MIFVCLLVIVFFFWTYAGQPCGINVLTSHTDTLSDLSYVSMSVCAKF